jgi:hypothetical protein
MLLQFINIDEVIEPKQEIRYENNSEQQGNSGVNRRGEIC